MQVSLYGKKSRKRSQKNNNKIQKFLAIFSVLIFLGSCACVEKPNVKMRFDKLTFFKESIEKQAKILNELDNADYEEALKFVLTEHVTTSPPVFEHCFHKNGYFYADGLQSDGKITVYGDDLTKYRGKWNVSGKKLIILSVPVAVTGLVEKGEYEFKRASVFRGHTLDLEFGDDIKGFNLSLKPHYPDNSKILDDCMKNSMDE